LCAASVSALVSHSLYRSFRDANDRPLHDANAPPWQLIALIGVACTIALLVAWARPVWEHVTHRRFTVSQSSPVARSWPGLLCLGLLTPLVAFGPLWWPHPVSVIGLGFGLAAVALGAVALGTTEGFYHSPLPLGGHRRRGELGLLRTILSVANQLFLVTGITAVALIGVAIINQDKPPPPWSLIWAVVGAAMLIVQSYVFVVGAALERAYRIVYELEETPDRTV
jgi:hypothetical protein